MRLQMVVHMIYVTMIYVSTIDVHVRARWDPRITESQGCIVEGAVCTEVGGFYLECGQRYL
jgi:hypothetical protein